MGTRVEDSENRRSWRELLSRTSIGQANEELSKSPYSCTGPLGHHTVSQFERGHRRSCLSCNKKLITDDNGLWRLRNG